MKKFENIDPNKIDTDPRVILKFTEYVDAIERDSFYYLLQDDGYLIWAGRDLFPSINGAPSKWSGGTDLEFPASGLAWFINVLEEKFFKTEAEGGLEKGKFAYEEEIMGERLCVSRMFGTSGYAFRNYSRRDYVTTLYESPQQASFSDELLFEKGLFDQLKVIAAKIENGEL